MEYAPRGITVEDVEYILTHSATISQTLPSRADLHGKQPMSATPETIVAYLESLADAGAKVATIKRRLSSISMANEICGHGSDNPARSTITCD